MAADVTTTCDVCGEELLPDDATTCDQCGARLCEDCAWFACVCTGPGEDEEA